VVRSIVRGLTVGSATKCCRRRHCGCHSLTGERVGCRTSPERDEYAPT